MFLGLTGRLAGVTDSFPANMVKVLANQLGTDATAIATIKSIYRGKAGPQAEGSVERRLREQRTWARQTLGFEVFAPEIERELAATLTMRARDAASQAELVTFAEEWLYERRIVLPGVSTLEDRANAAFRAIETLAMEVINGAIKPAPTSIRDLPPRAGDADRGGHLLLEGHVIFQRQNHSMDYEGVGTGLALVHRITERHSGRIWCDTAPSQGCTFYLELPTPEQADFQTDVPV